MSWQLNGIGSQKLISKDILRDVHICFDVKANPPDLGIIEVNAIKTWLD